MHTAYILLGSNTGDSRNILRDAGSALQARNCAITASSGLWETAPWGYTDQPAFLNQALELQTTLPADKLLGLLLDIEREAGRERTARWAPRTLDMDILFFGEMIIAEPGLTIPHPHLQDRRFALAPLAEIAPAHVHPVLQKTVAELLSDCPDLSPVSRIDQNLLS